jgi:Raf kinase inhibitor-like YbhB/YbcL family protein
MRRALIGLLVAPLLVSCGRSTPTDAVLPDDPEKLTIHLQSPAFADGGMIPQLYTCDGKDVSPPLTWSDVPAAARSLALICEDPDAPRGTWTHWLLFNLPADRTELGEGIPPEERVPMTPGGAKEDAARQGRNDFGKLGYGGPCPPRGTHRYLFLLYALDTRLNLKPGIGRAELLQAIKGHILAEGRLMGRYSRS